jgi:hypothetical protein
VLVTEHFGLTRTDQDDWFDPILDYDTQLGVDPFLIFHDDQQLWADAHDELISYFNRCFLFVADGIQNVESLSYRKARDLLLFPEPKEFCLGYTRFGTAGSGGGRGTAAAIAAAMAEAINRGVHELRHFEELGILNENIGMDRISDITLTFLKPRFITYTQEVAKRHRLPLERHTLPAASYDKKRHRWRRSEVLVPTNPTNGKALLFTPERFLDDLPALNADDWWDWYETEQLKSDLNYEIMGKVSKGYIVAVARRHPDAVRQWTMEREGRRAKPYDLSKDKKGVWQWDRATTAFTRREPISIEPPTTDDEFYAVIGQLLDQYGLFVSEQGGWRLLWNDDGSEKNEEAAQLIFYGMSRNYCRVNNVVVDREVELGRGPVDFKFSNGYSRRALLEIKKLHNGKFWNGLRQQLPSYMNSDDCNDGWFVAIRYLDAGVSEKRWRELPSEVDQVANELGLRLRTVRIDGRRKPSASKL